MTYKSILSNINQAFITFLQGVGELVELCILWQNDLQQEHLAATMSNEYLPYALQHPQICLGLCGLIQDNLYAQIGG